MRTASNLILAVAILIAAAVIAMYPVHAQTTSGGVVVMPLNSQLSSCAWPSDANPSLGNSVAFCATSSGLAYAVAPSTTFTLIGGTSAVLPQTLSPAAGSCLTGYSATTGIFSTAACVPSVTITKAQVLATGVAAVTTLQ